MGEWTRCCIWVSVHLFYTLTSCMNLTAASMHVFHGCLCAAPASVCACVPLIALVTQAVSHTHCSKLRVGEGHCGADRGDGKASRDGGWAGENENEQGDDKKLKAARKWDVGLHSRAVVFTIKKKSINLPGGLSFFHPFEARASHFSAAEEGGLSAKDYRNILLLLYIQKWSYSEDF